MIQIHRNPIVQKYGGSSLSSLEKVRTVARKVVESARGGQPVVVVVSAMGNTTSELIERARELSMAPSRRELDVLLSSGERMSMALLAMAIEEAGCEAISLTGPQSGIITDDEHTNASILHVQPERILRELAGGRIVIVAGYQGLATNGEVTTLGRGGSDTTAVALAGALGADRCEIYSDVPGVYTADPRLVDEPLHVKCVDARAMTEYALHGARVLHPSCIELAGQFNVPVHALATFGDDTQTIIRGGARLEFSDGGANSPLVVGVTSRKERLRIQAGDRQPETFERVLADLSEEELLRCERVTRHDGLLDLEDLPDPEEFTAKLRERLGGAATLTEGLASVSIVSASPLPADMQARVERVLASTGAQVRSTYGRPLSVTCAIDPKARPEAVRALHQSLIEEPMTIGV